MTWLPNVRVLTVRNAWPVESTATLPRKVPPSKKLTVPLGMPPPGGIGAIVAVKVTGWPSGEPAVPVDEVTVVVVPTLLTVKLRLALLGTSCELPAYDAVMVWAPTVRPLVVMLTVYWPLPLACRLPLPRI